MTRIQQILDKAEREGRMRRTTPLTGETPGKAASPPAAPQPSADRAALPPRLAAASMQTVAVPPAAAAAPTPLRQVVTSVPSPVVPAARPAEARPTRMVVAALQPHSVAAEQYRALRTRIAQSENGRSFRALLITSPAQGDGKTITALNLAIAMAQEFHRRVLLVDGDLRHPALHRLLGIPGRPGLSDVLTGTAPLDDALVSIPEYRLTVLPAGNAVDRTTELLGSAEMRRLVDTLRTHFDRIVFDTPPAAPLADVSVLAPLVDGVLLVVRAGRTQRPAIDRAVEDIEPSRMLGLVLNDVEEPAMDYGYYDAPPPPASAERRIEGQREPRARRSRH